MDTRNAALNMFSNNNPELVQEFFDHVISGNQDEILTMLEMQSAQDAIDLLSLEFLASQDLYRDPYNQYTSAPHVLFATSNETIFTRFLNLLTKLKQQGFELDVAHIIKQKPTYINYQHFQAKLDSLLAPTEKASQEISLAPKRKSLLFSSAEDAKNFLIDTNRSIKHRQPVDLGDLLYKIEYIQSEIPLINDFDLMYELVNAVVFLCKNYPDSQRLLADNRTSLLYKISTSHFNQIPLYFFSRLILTENQYEFVHNISCSDVKANVLEQIKDSKGTNALTWILNGLSHERPLGMFFRYSRGPFDANINNGSLKDLFNLLKASDIKKNPDYLLKALLTISLPDEIIQYLATKTLPNPKMGVLAFDPRAGVINIIINAPESTQEEIDKKLFLLATVADKSSSLSHFVFYNPEKPKDYRDARKLSNFQKELERLTALHKAYTNKSASPAQPSPNAKKSYTPKELFEEINKSERFIKSTPETQSDVLNYISISSDLDTFQRELALLHATDNSTALGKFLAGTKIDSFASLTTTNNASIAKKLESSPFQGLEPNEVSLLEYKANRSPQSDYFYHFLTYLLNTETLSSLQIYEHLCLRHAKNPGRKKPTLGLEAAGLINHNDQLIIKYFEIRAKLVKNKDTVVVNKLAETENSSMLEIILQCLRFDILFKFIDTNTLTKENYAYLSLTRFSYEPQQEVLAHISTLPSQTQEQIYESTLNDTNNPFYHFFRAGHFTPLLNRHLNEIKKRLQELKKIHQDINATRSHILMITQLAASAAYLVPELHAQIIAQGNNYDGNLNAGIDLVINGNKFANLKPNVKWLLKKIFDHQTTANILDTDILHQLKRLKDFCSPEDFAALIGSTGHSRIIFTVLHQSLIQSSHAILLNAIPQQNSTNTVVTDPKRALWEYIKDNFKGSQLEIINTICDDKNSDLYQFFHIYRSNAGSGVLKEITQSRITYQRAPSEVELKDMGTQSRP